MAKKPAAASKTKKITKLAPQVQDIAIDGVHGAFIHAGTVRMNLYVNAFDPETNEVGRTVTHRAVVPLLDFMSFADTLGQLKDEITRMSAQSDAEPAAKPASGKKN